MRRDEPPSATAYALFAYEPGGTLHPEAAGWIGAALAERGIAVRRVEAAGPSDLLAAAAALRGELRAPALLLVGHGAASAAALAATRELPEVVAVATLGAPSATPELPLEALRAVAAELHRPLLVFHSPLDEAVAIENAWRLLDAAKQPKSFVSLDNADHALSRARDARYAGEVLAAWAARYVEVEEEGPGVDAGAQEGVLVVAGPRGLAQRIVARRHRLRADEPEAAGGTDTGPTPYDLLVAALGACTGMTLRLYAERKGLPLEGVRVRLRHGRIHAADCAACETKEGKVDRIERDIELLGQLAPEQRQRLLEIADRCPVHRTLTSEISIVSRLV
ncbi:MAG TPA: bifunctional alpha/beta hydrolase/OsmC family protein [Thermoanaerobaculia bacterium]